MKFIVPEAEEDVAYLKVCSSFSLNSNKGLRLKNIEIFDIKTD